VSNARDCTYLLVQKFPISEPNDRLFTGKINWLKLTEYQHGEELYGTSIARQLPTLSKRSDAYSHHKALQIGGDWLPR
jgi:hypothetical protein